MNLELYSSVKKLWDHSVAHSIYESAFAFPIHLVISGPDGMLLVLEYKSLDQEPILLLEHSPMSQTRILLPQNISIFCRELAPVHVRIVQDQKTQQPKIVWELSGRRRSDHATPEPPPAGIELSRAAFAGGRG